MSCKEPSDWQKASSSRCTLLVTQIRRLFPPLHTPSVLRASADSLLNNRHASEPIRQSCKARAILASCFVKTWVSRAVWLTWVIGQQQKQSTSAAEIEEHSACVNPWKCAACAVTAQLCSDSHFSLRTCQHCSASAFCLDISLPCYKWDLRRANAFELLKIALHGLEDNDTFLSWYYQMRWISLMQ